MAGQSLRGHPPLWLVARIDHLDLSAVRHCTGRCHCLCTPALTPLYQWQTVAIALFQLLIGIALRELDKSNYEVGNTRRASGHVTPPAPAATDGPIQTQPTTHSAGIVAAIAAGVVIFAVISAVSSERHEATLAEKLCAEANARMSDGVEQAVRDGAGLLDRVLGTKTATRIPCDDD